MGACRSVEVAHDVRAQSAPDFSPLIRYLPPLESGRRCPLCRRPVTARSVLDAQNPFDPETFLRLYRCGTCTSCFYDPLFHVPKEQYYSERLIKYVCETVRGLDNFVTHCLALEPDNRRRTFLDLGCGLGLSVDFARRCLGWEAVGVEPSPWGEIGRAAFQLPIYDRYLEQIDALQGKTFGVVYASEVIEHVPDPIALLTTLTRYVADDGLLLLTTPNALRLEAGASLAEHLNILAPADHMVLFTPDSLEAALKLVGFTHVTILKVDSQIVCCASARPLSLHAASYPPASTRPVYLNYLRELVGRSSGVPRLQLGLTFRLCAELMREGLYEEAQTCLNRLSDDLRTRGEAALLDPLVATDRAMACGSSHDFIDRCPGHLAGLHYYLGLHAAQSAQHYDRAIAHLQACFNITAHCLTFGLEYFAEDVERLWDAPYHIGHCYLRMRNWDAAIETFGQIVHHRADRALPSPREDLRNQSTYYLAEALFQRERFDECLPHLRQVLATERRNGWGVLGERAADLFGRATGRMLAAELGGLTDRHAYRQCLDGLRNTTGGRLSRLAVWRLTIAQALHVVTSQGLRGVLARVKSRLG